MLEALQFIATLSAALFAGAAVYINLVEHPARMSCGTEVAATVWAPSYKRATVLQVPLAIASTLAGSASWVLGGGSLWLVGSLLIFSVVPFTLAAIMPTNARLLAPGRDLAAAETRALLERWARLHGVRSALGLAATIAYLASLLRT
ncbi:MAG: DUF1772 domain-containing protein [Candidatus Rokubacteria bacterium]|nr:DUF1772 domain-containing protein [Candidatus Rokubacteria bacterium]